MTSIDREQVNQKVSKVIPYIWSVWIFGFCGAVVANVDAWAFWLAYYGTFLGLELFGAFRRSHSHDTLSEIVWLFSAQPGKPARGIFTAGFGLTLVAHAFLNIILPLHGYDALPDLWEILVLLPVFSGLAGWLVLHFGFGGRYG